MNYTSLKIFDRKVILRGALYGFLFALCVGTIVFTQPEQYRVPSLWSWLSDMISVLFAFSVVAPITHNIFSPVGAIVLVLFWSLIGALLAALLHNRSRGRQAVIWILSIVVYLAYVLLAPALL